MKRLKPVESLILTIRSRKVMVDSDLAGVYGVETRSLNQAVAMSVYVVRAFVRMREQLAANTAILKRLAEIDKTLLQHDTALRDIYHKLLPLLQPPPAPPTPPKRRIGFISDDE